MSAETEAEMLYEHLAQQSLKLNRRLTKEEWLKHAAECLKLQRRRRSRPKGDKAPRPARPRNVLFDALALAMGGKNLAELTKNALKSIGVALQSIVEVSPGLTAEEINRRAAAYKRRWPDPRNWSPTALAKHWHEFGEGEPTSAAKFDVYIEPVPAESWHAAAVEIFGENTASLMIAKGWADLGTDYRKQILVELARRPAA